MSNTAETFWANVQKKAGNGCWPWLKYKDKFGYGKYLWGTKVKLAHRIAFELAFRAPTESESICHQCDNPSCCNPSHLFAGTHSDNMRDLAFKGRLNGPAKLTAEQYGEIKALLAEGKLKQKAIAKLYGIAESHVTNIKQGVTPTSDSVAGTKLAYKANTPEQMLITPTTQGK